jgi:hypothetical protein
MNWKKIGLETNLQKSFFLCERHNDYFGDGCDENFHYGQSLSGSGWGCGFSYEDGDGAGFLIPDNDDDDENLSSSGDGLGDASGFIEVEIYGSRNGNGSSSE